MRRSGLIVALAILAGAGFVLGLFPTIDLSVARYFYAATHAVGGASMSWLLPLAHLVRGLSVWIEVPLVALPVIALVVKLVWPRSRMLIPGRAVVLLLTSLILVPGLLVNGVLKSHWERPRPGHLVQFGGKQHFVPWWEPRGDCHRNCSFVSGEASAAFWTLAPAALLPPLWRPLAYTAAVTFGVTVSAARMVMGGHFLSDTIFAGALTFLAIWLLYAVMYRWQRTYLDDRAIEEAIEHLSAICSLALRRLRRRGAGASPARAASWQAAKRDYGCAAADALGPAMADRSFGLGISRLRRTPTPSPPAPIAPSPP